MKNTHARRIFENNQVVARVCHVLVLPSVGLIWTYEGVFLRRVLMRDAQGTVYFVIDEADETSWAREDIVFKLPVPQISESSRRPYLRFNVNFEQ